MYMTYTVPKHILCVHVRVHLYAYVHDIYRTYAHVHNIYRTCTLTCACTFTRKCTCSDTCTCMCTCTCTCTCFVHVYVHVCVCTCIWVHVCTWRFLYTFFNEGRRHRVTEANLYFWNQRTILDFFFYPLWSISRKIASPLRRANFYIVLHKTDVCKKPQNIGKCFA